MDSPEDLRDRDTTLAAVRWWRNWCPHTLDRLAHPLIRAVSASSPTLRTTMVSVLLANPFLLLWCGSN